ncbi:hypothetical protein JB92DRAFT_1143230 [Gautieria morchelliformis]|nr:hypothetical protein JB92DRAFT_1143230 [Gautieria morchelliformis]
MRLEGNLLASITTVRIPGSGMAIVTTCDNVTPAPRGLPDGAQDTARLNDPTTPIHPSTSRLALDWNRTRLSNKNGQAPHGDQGDPRNTNRTNPTSYNACGAPSCRASCSGGRALTKPDPNPKTHHKPEKENALPHRQQGAINTSRRWAGGGKARRRCNRPHEDAGGRETQGARGKARARVGRMCVTTIIGKCLWSNKMT